jgi:hypothetical protein
MRTKPRRQFSVKQERSTMLELVPYLRTFTKSKLVQAVSAGAIILTLAGCVKPAASSSFVEMVEKEGRIEGQKPSNSARAQTGIEMGRSFRSYAGLVKTYADRYHLDWPLVLAVMKQESRFDQEAVSHRGAYGLMQIMPITQSELIDKLGVTDASTPRNNIRAGTFHLRSLYHYFSKATGDDRIQLSLAAYNVGLKRVIAARDIAKYLGGDPNSWSAVKNALPLLSRRYYSLHADVWHDDKPPCGYFGGWRQTLAYVDNIMQYYNDYSLALK